MTLAPQETRLAREANELIEAKYKLDIWEARLFLAALAEIRPDDVEFKKYKIHIKDFKDRYGINDKDVYARIRKAAKSLRKKDITIPYQYEEGLGEFTTGLITGSGSVETDGEGSFIAVDIHPDLKPYLLQLKERFTQYNVMYLMQMSSAYSRMMYKLLKQYKKIGKRRFTVENLREFLCVEDHEYPKYSNFKQKVILKAQLDLPKYTDIRFDFKEEKRGRRVHTLEFLIHSNEPQNKITDSQQSDFAEQTELGTQFYKTVKPWGVAPASVDEFIGKYGEKRLSLAIRYIQNRLAKGDKISNKAGYLHTIIKNENLADPIEEQKQNLSVERKAKIVAAQKTQQEAMSKQQKEEAYSQQKNIIIQSLLKDQPNLLEDAFEKAKRNALFSNSFDHKRSIEENYKNKPVVKALMDRAIQDMKPESFERINEIMN